MNLIVNAAQAIPERGTITIETSRQADSVRIVISDDGVGIPSENLSRVFDPGFTTKGVGVGTGLGLSICYKIIQQHRGKIAFESDGRGTTFTIDLPIAHKKRVKHG
jgi:two-component system NtrC family sensor kinase